MAINIYLNNILIPKHGEITRADMPNESDNRTLGGTLYTDFLYNLREWNITWNNMLYDDYLAVYEIFLGQYSGASYPILDIPEWEIVNVPVKMETTNPRSIILNGVLVKQFTITLKEQYPFS